uniref:Uncharacterized protein n=1 Tax=Timema douglasi TaxID=61478 RepID=A0A7R8VNV2_TIMDO|nr:unnamed protein product [Timema douglasi]
MGEADSRKCKSERIIEAIKGGSSLFWLFSPSSPRLSPSRVAPKETLKGAEAVYLASPYAYGGYGGYGAYGAYPYASAYGAYPTAYSGYYYR